MDIPNKQCIICNEIFYNSRINKSGHRIRRYTKEKWKSAKYCSHKCYWSDNTRTSNRSGTGKSEGYSAIHKWVTREKGFARDNKCVFCKEQAKEWANIDNSYRRKLSEYIALCISCHRKFDRRHST